MPQAVLRQPGPRITRMSDRGRVWLARLEGGVALHTYLDSAGVPTIGVGMTYWPRTRKRVEMGETLPSVAQGVEMFGKTLRDFEAGVDASTHDAITQETFDALCSFAYNVGQPAFARSTALRLLNQGQPLSAVCGALRLWNKAGGEVVPGLVERRECECDLILHGIYRIQGGAEVAA